MPDESQPDLLRRLQRIQPPPGVSREQIRDERLEWSHELNAPGVWDGTPSTPRTPAAADEEE